MGDSNPYREQEEREEREDRRRAPWSRRAHLVARMAIGLVSIAIGLAIIGLPVPQAFQVAAGVPFLLGGIASGLGGALALISHGPAPIGSDGEKKSIRYWSSPLNDTGHL